MKKKKQNDPEIAFKHQNQQHWLCKCDQTNHFRRKVCVKCGAGRTVVLRHDFDKAKSECLKCVGSILCRKHKKMYNLIGRPNEY